MNRTSCTRVGLRMRNFTFACHHSRLRARQLAVCIAAAVSPALWVAANASSPPAMHDLAFLANPLAGQPSPHSPNPPWIVQNCDNDGVGSLRHVIASVAQSGDTVDLSQLTCSTITLTTGGEIVVTQDDLTLLGPTTRTLTISGNNASRVIDHTGVGLLDLQFLEIVSGYEHQVAVGSAALGGCIFTAGSVRLYRSSVAECKASSDDDRAHGGGIYANKTVTLEFSAVSGNSAINLAPTALVSYGGGVDTDSLVAKYSSIESNVASTATFSGFTFGHGGGARTRHNALVVSSTLNGNQAASGGALETGGTLQIQNSTISYNTAEETPALAAKGAADGTISGSTISFNHATGSNSPGAVYLYGQLANTTFDLQSCIVANNTAGAGNTPSDLYLKFGILTGAGNLVITTNQSPPQFTSATGDPKLGPLQFNGGWTKTHALLPGSPAIGMGNNNATWAYDQRGPGYPRTTGAAAKADIGAFQFDSIFAGSFK